MNDTEQHDPTLPLGQAVEVTYPRTERFKFHGMGGEYFGILFVNALLVMLTLGIYSPWAKVRDLQYLYGNTELAGGSFQFTADPRRMLVSRLIAVALFILYVALDNIATDEALIAYGLMTVAFLVVAPVITVFVMSFRLRFSAWRGVNFRFNKDFRGGYRVYLAPMGLLLAVFLALQVPLNSKAVEEFLGMDRHVRIAEEAAAEQAAIEANDAAAEAYGYQREDSAEAPYADAYADGSADEFDYGVDENGEPIVADGEDAYDTYEAGEHALEDFYINPYFFYLPGALALVFLLLVPYFDFINVRYLARNIRFGQADFRYGASASQYYQVYFRWLLAAGILLVLWVLYAASDLVHAWATPLFLASLLFVPATRAYMKSKRYNLLVNHSAIDGGKYRLQADVPFLHMFWIILSNTLLVVISFGLMKAWAYIRVQRFLFEHTALEVHASLDEFVIRQEEQQSALAEEFADVFDIDVPLG